MLGALIATSACLLLGALLTVAVAWAPVVWPGMVTGGVVEVSEDLTHEEMQWWEFAMSPRFDDKPTVAYRIVTSPVLFEFVQLISNEALGGPSAMRWRSGLPARSMGHFSWTANSGNPKTAIWHPTGRWDIRVHRRGGLDLITLPLTPLWPGFVIDTTFFAALAAVIRFGWRWVVRRTRLARGRCPACNYPVGTSPVCTECGEALAVVGVPWSKRGSASAGHASAPSADEPV